MNYPWLRRWRSAYRREPLPTFVLTVGLVDLGLGGLSQHGSLAAVGLGTVVVAVALRQWQQRPRKSKVVSRPPEALPHRPAHRVLPPLDLNRRSPS
ncbi:hypothetical protein [Leptolyngbya sp. FACHB-261]|uniref:hypothetical protein n=1 Tax=Leptolyngbya sp. FACHB-261 TaxID=2692806 RepID=UPI001687BE69|nr:hypothetical protein [Leptolyngbya sp. FACHB-261]MBD2099324.1 hypothetical protein [Leptolyngbya sp. FACHB-261]